MIIKKSGLKPAGNKIPRELKTIESPNIGELNECLRSTAPSITAVHIGYAHIHPFAESANNYCHYYSSLS